MDPNNVLIRCPNGHELQAAKTDLDKPLACPICNVTFTPSSGPGSPPSGTATPSGPGPVVDYESDLMSSPIAYPGYTNWMLGLWTALFMMSAVFSLLDLSGLTTKDAAPPTPSLGAMMMPCFVLIALITAFVLQLMWIYRVHKDAKRARGYTSVSPILALVLCLIPGFNFAWTAWTMKKLAAFVGREDAAEDSAEAQALRSTTLCLIAGIVLGISYCVTFGVISSVWFQAMGQLMQEKITQTEMAKKINDSLPFAWQVISPLISVACVLIYFRAVRTLEAALYPFLGAPNR